jgi:hypothetical protein
VTTAEVLELLRSADRSVFRLETLDRYTVSAEDEDYQRWSRGESPPPIGGHPWFDDVVRAAAMAGKRWERVHVVRPPLSDYLRFEFEYGYTRSEQAGEGCHILEVAEGEHAPVPALDFWLVDDKAAVLMHYDAEGRVLDRELVTDPDAVGDLCRRRDLTLQLAVPFRVWLDRTEGAGRL